MNESFPEIRDAFNALCPPEISPLSTESLQSLCSTSPVRSTSKKPTPSQIPFSIKSPVKPNTSSPAPPPVNHTDLLQLSNIESRITEMLQSIDKLNLEDVFRTTVENYNELIKHLSNVEAKVCKLSAKNTAYESPTLKMLVNKLTMLESKLTNTYKYKSSELLDIKEKQISLLMSEITEKNKEVQLLSKVNSSISSSKNEMNQLRQALAVEDKKPEMCEMSLKNRENYENELNDAITLLKEKQLEIKNLNEDLAFIRSKLHDKEEEIVLLQSKNFEMKNQVLQMESIKKDLVITNKELELTKTECVCQSNVLSEKNGIIPDLLLSKSSQDPDGSSSKVDQGSINMLTLKEVDHLTSAQQSCARCSSDR